MPPILNADAPPDMRLAGCKPKFAPEQVSHPIGALREDLENMPGRRCHHLSDLDDEILSHAVMEKVAHRVNKDHSRLSPAEWGLKMVAEESNRSGPNGTS